MIRFRRITGHVLTDHDPNPTDYDSPVPQPHPTDGPAEDAPPAPLHAALEAAGAQFIPWGDSGAQIAEHFDAFEAEYAALRQRVGVIHLPQRGVLKLAGDDVKDYLHRLCTQEINGQAGGASVRAFQLNERGHVTADLMVHLGDAGTWLEGDADDLPALAKLILARQFTEDLTLREAVGACAVFWLIGPAAVRLLSAAARDDAARETAARVGAMPGTHHVLDLEGAPGVTAYRHDLGQLLGVRVVVAARHAAELYPRLLAAAGHEHTDPAVLNPEEAAAFAGRRRASLRGRPVGWSAFNTVRIEEGVPLYHVDFGPTSLPAEVPGPHGIDQAVSFTKGCYLGQEVVARMKSLGHPKKLLVAFRVDRGVDHGVDGPDGIASGVDNPTPHPLPVAGAQVFDADDPTKVIGAVTSSAASPLAGQTAIGFAVVRWGRHRPGTALRMPADGRLIDARVVSLDAPAAADA